MRLYRYSLPVSVLCLAAQGCAQLRADDLPVVILRTPAAQMKYDKPVITASPGAQVRLVFENLDGMPHNWVLCHPLPDKNDKGMEVARLAWELGAAGPDKAWIPDSSRILAHSGMVAPHQKEELVVKIPDEPGVYPFLCTFPGHAMAMNGELRVLREGPLMTQLNYQLYLGDWKKMPDFSTLTPHRSGALPDRKLTVELEGYTQHFAVQYDGTLEVPADGEYSFHLASDDGSELIIDGKPLMKNDGVHAASDVRTKKVRLKQGSRRIQLNYFEATGEEQLYLAWSGAMFSETPLSQWVHPSRSGKDEIKAPADEFKGMPLAPENGEAVIYRNFITGVSPRGIAVGYPNGVNLCFDADQVAPALFWQGAFIDAKRHWTGRGGGQQPPLGYNLFKPAPAGPAVALLPGEDTPWPAARDRATMLRFRGYRLDDKRFPTFKYETGSVTITENYQPAGTTAGNDLRVTRNVYFSALEPMSGLYMRAAAGSLVAEDAGWKGEGFRITVEQGPAVLRGDDLLVPVIFTGDTAIISLTYHWKP